MQFDIFKSRIINNFICEHQFFCQIRRTQSLFKFIGFRWFYILKKNHEQFNSTKMIYLKIYIPTYVSQENTPRAIYLEAILKENRKQLRSGAAYLPQISGIKNFALQPFCN